MRPSRLRRANIVAIRGKHRKSRGAASTQRELPRHADAPCNGRPTMELAEGRDRINAITDRFLQDGRAARGASPQHLAGSDDDGCRRRLSGGRRQLVPISPISTPSGADMCVTRVGEQLVCRSGPGLTLANTVCPCRGYQRRSAGVVPIEPRRDRRNVATSRSVSLGALVTLLSTPED